MEELAALFTAESWSDVRSDWPAEPILRFIPGTDSGTFDYFVEEVFEEDAEPILAAANTQLSEDDNVLVQGVQGSPNAIGFFGFAYYSENQDGLGILAIDGVEANAANVDNNSYPLARPLYIYSDAGIIAEKPQVGQFISYFLTFVNEEVEEVGYFPAASRRLGWRYVSANGSHAISAIDIRSIGISKNRLESRRIIEWLHIPNVVRFLDIPIALCKYKIGAANRVAPLVIFG